MIDLVKYSQVSLILVLKVLLVGADISLHPNFSYGHTIVLDYKLTNYLYCNISGVSNTDEYMLKWLKRGEGDQWGPVVPTENRRIELKDNKLIMRKLNDDDVANYSCALYKKDDPNTMIKSAEIETVGKPLAKLPPQITVTEGEKLKLECIVSGKPHPSVEWLYGNNPIDRSMENPRIQLGDDKEKGVVGAFLQIDQVHMDDRGEYTCSVTLSNEHYASVSNSTTYVRVKDKFAALWPFIGICAEVAVLCAIIFIYERKRNKAELEESDTDQSPEQKNTPDHGKDSVRQRK